MSINKYVVSKDDSIYEAWPDLVLTNGGKLICIFTECKYHLDRALSRLVICESTDRGKTWSDKKAFTERAQQKGYYNNARISKLKDGTLVVLCDFIEKKETNSGVIHMWLGNVEGTDWVGPIETPGRGIVPDKLLELKSGRWIMACHSRNPETQKLEEYTWYSDDKGKTWSDKIIIASDENYNLCEASVLELSGGTLVAFLRENSFIGLDGFKAFSYDNGESWEGVYKMPIPGLHRPTSGYLQNGDIMITHRFLQGGKQGIHTVTQNTFATFIHEECALKKERNEQYVRIMPLDYDRSINPDTGYTGWVQFEDGEIYVVNYIIDDSTNSQIRGYSFTMGDVVL